MSHPFDPLIGRPVQLVSGDFAGYRGTVAGFEPAFGSYIIHLPGHRGATFPIAATIDQFRPIAMGPEIDPDTALAPEQVESDLMPEVPAFGMTQREAAQYTADFVSTAAQAAATYKPEGGYLTFEALEFGDLLAEFWQALAQQAADLAAMAVRVARLFDAYTSQETE